MVHFNTLNFSCDVGWRKGATILWLRTPVSLAHRDHVHTTSPVDTVKGRQAQRLAVDRLVAGHSLYLVWFHLHCHLASDIPSCDKAC